MSDDVTSTSCQSEEPVRSPLAGCLILFMIGAVVLGVVGFAAYSFKKQTEGFASFTEEKETPAPLADSAEPELRERLSTFRPSEDTQTLSLSIADLNASIATFQDLDPLRRQIYFTGIQEGKIHGQLHLPLASTKELPGVLTSALNIAKRDHFLKATFTGQPLLSDGVLYLALDTVTPSKGQLPPQVIQALSPLRIFGEDSKAQEILSALTAVEVTPTGLLAIIDPSVTPPSGTAEGDEIAERATHFVALGALIFILTLILALMIFAKRKKARRSVA